LKDAKREAKRTKRAKKSKKAFLLFFALFVLFASTLAFNVGVFRTRKHETVPPQFSTTAGR